MKTIGLIGGITWHSTIDYYRALNELVNQRTGGVNFARIIMYSVNFADIKLWTETDRWDLITEYLTNIAIKLQVAGADCIMIAANTMHKVAPDVQLALQIPLLHIAEATSSAIKDLGLKKVALLGTKYTMELDFFKDILIDHGITAITPAHDDRLFINHAIYEEMGKGQFLQSTKARLLAIIQDLIRQQVQGIILGCTELPILISQDDVDVPLFDTGSLHAAMAVDFALEGKGG